MHLANSTLFFIGDSVTAQHYVAMTCRALHDAWAGEWAGIDAPQVVEVIPAWHSRLSSVRTQKRDSGIDHTSSLSKQAADQVGNSCKPRCATVSVRGRRTYQACFVAAGHDQRQRGVDGLTCTVPPDEAAQLLLQHGVLRAGDRAVLNDGLWYTPHTRPGRLKSLASRLAHGTRPLDVMHRAGQVQLFWRETSPQAFAGKDDGSFDGKGWYRLGSNQHCAAVRARQRKHAEEAALAHLEQHAQLPVIRIHDMTVTQFDARLDNRTPHVRGKLDCTHFCEPSGALEAWVDATLLAIAAAASP